jgi:hypothetical protein
VKKNFGGGLRSLVFLRYPSAKLDHYPPNGAVVHHGSSQTIRHGRIIEDKVSVKDLQ